MKAKNTEQQVLQAIRDNPYATQVEIGKKLGIARATVALHIERLQSKGMIFGRAYVLNEDASIACIGAMAVDQTFQLTEPLVLDTSNLSTRIKTCGGVARNVAENLARLNLNTHLISQIGDDNDGHWLMDRAREANINVDAVSPNQNYPTATYTAIMEPNGSLHMGISDMEIFNAMDDCFIHKNWKHIAGSKLVFCDTNGSQDFIHALIERAKKQKLPLYMDAVSTKKAKRLPKNLKGIKGLFCNLIEAQAILSDTSDDPKHLANKLVKHGAKTVFLTHGENGIWVVDKLSCAHVAAPQFTPDRPIIDVTGAGDALIAGTLYGVFNNLNASNAAKIGVKAAEIALQNTGANSPEIGKLIFNE